MIVLSGALVLVALVLLVVGAVGKDLPYVYGSIGVSVTALLLLFLSILQRRGQAVGGEQAGEAQLGATDEDEHELVPALVGAGEPAAQEQAVAADARRTGVSRLVRRPRPSEQDASQQDAPSAGDDGAAEVHDGSLEAGDAAYDEGREHQEEADQGEEAYEDEADEAAYEDEADDEDEDEDDAAYEDEAEDEAEDEDEPYEDEAAYEDEDTGAAEHDDHAADADDEEGVRLVPSPQTAQPQPTSSAQVLVVAGRPRYHLSGCRYLIGKSPESVGLDDVQSRGFSPCGVCKPDAVLAQQPQEAEDEQPRAWSHGEDEQQDAWAEDEQIRDEHAEDELLEDEQDEDEQDEEAPATTVPAARTAAPPDDDEPPTLEHVLFGEQVFPGPPAQADDVAPPEPDGFASSPAEPAQTEDDLAAVEAESAAQQATLAADGPSTTDASATAAELPTTPGATDGAPSPDRSALTAEAATETQLGEAPAPPAAPGRKSAKASGKAPVKKAPAKSTSKQAPATRSSTRKTQAGAATDVTASAAPTSGSRARPAVPEAPPVTPVRTTAVRAVRPDALRLASPTSATTTRRVAVRAAAPGLRPAAPPPAPPSGSSPPAARSGTTGRGAGRVVVIPDRGRFHRAECRYVRGVDGATTLTKAAAAKQGYAPCGVCQP